jgi:crotonobetainyl-CoA:carnitine CoA-transferase CaiB-like acyl-CoA transferase
LVEVATAVTADQVIRYSIDETLVDRRGAGGVYQTLGDDDWVAVDRHQDPLPPAERAAWCATRTAQDAASELRARGVAAQAMVRGYETLADPQMQARGFFEPIDNPLVGLQEYPTWPMRMSAGPEHYWTGTAPTLGQYTDEVLRELGVTDEELARLRDEHVIGEVPRFG